MKKIKLFLILFLVLAVPSYQVHAASNYKKFTYTITYKNANRIQYTVPYFPTGTIPLSDFIPNLDRLSGYSDPVNDIITISNFYLFVTTTVSPSGDSVSRNADWTCFLVSNSSDSSRTVAVEDKSSYDLSLFSGDLSSQSLRWTMTGRTSNDLIGWSYFGTTGVTVNFDIHISLSMNYYVTLGNVIDAIQDQEQSIVVELDKVEDAIRDGNQQQLDWRNEDKENATATQDTITNFANSTESTVKSKWAILFYPIEFTTRILGAFNGGTSSASYVENYGFVDGYTYNEETGGLEPIYNYNKPVLLNNDSVTITFPAFILPVLDLKLWDSYSFDLSVLKDNFPVLFNALYTVEGIIEIYLFVGFLQNKYDDVFGGI